MAKRRSRQFWRGTVAEFEAGDVPARVFAAERGLNVNTLKWWVGRFRGERRTGSREEGVGFLEVACDAGPLMVSGGRELVGLSSCPGVTVRVGAGVMLAFEGLPPAEYVARVARCYDGVSP